ncbi:MAG: hypothetical protein A4E63_01700 [Syntrophorhabdus sp. PtaU1.Bin050]|nr:MAG: hypothetical protein A4E63_01700 [Syntrophorhabdus sp. PtaU1.Bin050]
MEKMTGVQKENILGKGDHVYSIPFYGESRPMLIELVEIMDEKIQSRYDFVTREGSRVVAETHVPALYGGAVHI